MAASLSLAVGDAGASARPHYGGTLRLSIKEAPATLDPADGATGALANVSRLIFDTLVTLDRRGQTQPSLATSWQADPGNRRWQFNIRRGVLFHDGTAAGPEPVAASLRAANPNWKVFAAAESVVIECDAPTPNLPAALALPRYGIAKRAGGKLIGSGPFAISRWDPGKEVILTARDDYWGGRAFVDSVEIEMGKTFREQTISLDLGKADVIEISAEQARHSALEGRRIESSSPSEWMALVFSRDVQSASDGQLRKALALSIDRASMNTVLLQGGGEPAGAVLPNWLSGYAFLFPTASDLQSARQARGEVHAAPAWSLGYDQSDPLARVIAERVALNASDAGLTLQLQNLQTKSSADVRLVRMPLPSLDARVALSELAASLGLAEQLPVASFQFSETGNQKPEADTAGLYAAESALLQSQRVIPLLHLRTIIALGANVRGWQEDADGSWRLLDVWLETGKP